MKNIHIGIAQQASTKRVADLDVAKGTLMVLVVFGHAIQFVAYAGKGGFWSDPLFNIIYMFHMPLFMFYSGYFSPSRQMVFRDLGRRIVSLLYPMIAWVLVAALLRSAASGSFSALPSFFWGGIGGGYWFLWAVVFSVALVWFSERFGRYQVLIYSAACVSVMLAQPAWNVFSMWVFVLPFFIAGRWWRRSEALVVLEKYKAAGLYLTAVIAFGGCYFLWDYNTYIYNNRADFISSPVSVFTMFAGAAASTLIAFFVFSGFSRLVAGTAAGRWLQGLGGMTLEVYLVQGLVFSASSIFVARIPGAGSDFLATRWFASLFSCIFILFSIKIFVEFSRKIPMVSRVFWGR